MKHKAKRKKRKSKRRQRRNAGKHHRKPPPYHSRAPPSVLSFQKNINTEEKMRSKKFFQLFFIFELPKRRLLHSLYERENRTPLSQVRKEVRK